jgi:F-type H+-transporting ATPase subunit epsilon
MSESLQLRILTPLAGSVHTTASEVTLPGVEGEFVVLPGHTSYLAILEPGRLSWVSDGAAGRIALRGGLVEVRDDQVTVLAENLFRTTDLDRSALDIQEKDIRARIDRSVDTGESAEDLQRELDFVTTLKSLFAT